MVVGYDAFERLPAYQVYQSNFTATGSGSIFIPALNPNGEAMLYVVAQKMDGSNRNLTVSINYGAAVRSNSTIAPYGSVSVFIGVTP
jgi:hypothetical protein